MKIVPVFIVIAVLLSSCSEEKTSNSNALIESRIDLSPVKEKVVEDKERVIIDSLESEIKNSKIDTIIAEGLSKAQKLIKEDALVKETKSDLDSVLVKEVVVKPEEKNKPKISYKAYNELLNEYVSKEGFVDYLNFMKSISKLKEQVLYFQAVNDIDKWSKDEQLAYYINVYNSNTILLILNNYPLKSITDIEKPWDQKVVKIEGNLLSLNQLEHEIVRPTFNDPRIHVALNCAAVSCPKLLNEAFVSEKLQNQLSLRTNLWLRDTSSNRISKTELKLSKLFEWYKADFNGGEVKNYLMKNGFEINTDLKISYLEYNWSLNGN